MAEETKTLLGVHWGWIDGNNDLFEAGGYQRPESQLQSLGDGSQIELNEAVMKKTRDWYVAGGKNDAAGAGFYFSSGLTDSSRFGNDLLIVELIKDSNVTVPIIKMEADDIKDKADRALRSKEDSSLPLITRYRGNWHTISRLPTGEREKVKIIIRQPTAEDIPVLYERLTGALTPAAKIKFLSALASQLAMDKSDADGGEQKRTRGSEIVLDRIFFDHGYDEILKTTEAVQGIDPEHLIQIEKQFSSRIPNDPKTEKVRSKVLDLIKSPAGKNGAASSAVVKALDQLVDKFSERDRKELANWLPRHANFADFKNEFQSYLHLYQAISKYLKPATRSAWLGRFDAALVELNRPKMPRFISRLIPETKEEASFEKPRSATDLERMYAVLPGKRVMKVLASDMPKRFPEYLAYFRTLYPTLNGEGRALFKETLLSADPTQNPNFSLVLTDEVLADASELLGKEFVLKAIRSQLLRKWPNGHKDTKTSMAPTARYLAKIGELKLIEETVAIACRNPPPTRTEIFDEGASTYTIEPTQLLESVIQPLLEFTFDLPDSTSKLEWMEKLKRIIEDNSGKWSYKGNWFELDREATAYQWETAKYESFIRWVGQNFPLLNEGMLDELKHPQPHVHGTFNVPSLIAHLKSHKASRNWAPQIAAYYDSDVPAERKRADIKGKHRDRLLSALEPVSGSQSYSELSRTFTLVDPLLVSEDIRPPQNGNLPYRRFNSQISSGNGTEEHAAWENFNNAWELLARTIAAVNLSGAKGEPNLTKLDQKLGRVWGEALANGVDGTTMRKIMGPGGGIDYTRVFYDWDRSQYQTLLSSESWDALGAERTKDELNRYFDIKTESNGTRTLSFKSIDSLVVSFPALGKFKKALPKPSRHGPGEALALLQFIISEVYKEFDPVDRAAVILDLVTKLHPFENGNGRLAREWASMELVQAGGSLPVGLPTNDFLMSRSRLRSEIIRAQAIGKFWMQMLKSANAEGLPAGEFFQKRFKGSSLEGIMHLTPLSETELAVWGEWLSVQNEPPQWEKDIIPDLESQISEIRNRHGAVVAISEEQRHLALDKLWKRQRNSASFPREIFESGCDGPLGTLKSAHLGTQP